MNYTYAEICNQPNSWEITIQAATDAWESIKNSVRIRADIQFLFLGCGTSYYLSQSAAALFQELTGHVARAVPASEVFLSPASVVTRSAPTVAFAISRSGTTSEVLLAAKFLTMNFPNVELVGVTCNKENELSHIVSPTLALSHAAEQSVVMTQSFTNMLLALQVIAAKIAGREDVLAELSALPKALRNQLTDAERFAKTLADDLSRKYYVFLGLGKYYGLANEANLKLKEMTQVFSEAYNPLEYRHGPISMLNSQSCVVLIGGDEAEEYLDDLYNDLIRTGSHVAYLNSKNVGQGFSDWSRTVLYMPTLQYLAYYKSIALGLNPDEPRNLTKVVVIEAK
jgi:glucosamine--fructose-6-phosphate aminotransferase (isomerizing)